MPDELQELREQAEEGAHNASLAPVTVTMAIFAVLVAAVSLLGHRAHTEELLHQTKATDQWAYYQAKDIRQHAYELFLDETSVFALQNPDQAQKVKEKYQKEADRYRDEEKEIEAEANKAEDEVKIERRRADRFDLGEVMLEAALVICSITLLTRKRAFWILGTALGLCGLAIGAAGLFIH
jgi:cell division septum initiation protein DivIVA